MADVLNPQTLEQSLEKLDGWQGTTEQIAKDYRLKDFGESINFVERVAELAEHADHHPDIHISYNRVRLELATHSAGGVTQKDLDLAARIDGTSR